METQDRASAEPEVNILSLETEPHLDTLQYDDEEQRILMQMADENEVPLSPGLEAAMEKSQKPSKPIEQSHPATLLVESPLRSGIDATGFCFTRPTAVHKVSVKSTKSSTKQPPNPETTRTEPGASSSLQKYWDTTQEKQAPSTSHSRSHSQQVSSDDDNHIKSGIQAPVASKTQKHGVLEDRKEIDYGKRSLKNGTNNRKVQVKQVARSPPVTLYSSQPEVDYMNKHGNGVHPIPKHDRRGGVVASCDNASTVQDDPSTVSFIAPSQDRFRISKRNHAPRKPAQEKQPLSPSTEDDGSQLTEDTLFQLLITRIRQREEEAIHAAKDHKQLETIASKLAEENGVLKEELHIHNAHLQKKALESKMYKSQINNWKSKLGKFRSFLDSLGIEFQTLRGESIHLKATKNSLNREGKELRNDIEDIRTQVSQATSALLQKKSYHLEYEGIICALGHDLERSAETTKFAQSQLHEERKRATALEAYIHNHCHAQGRDLALMRSGQFGIEKKIDSAFEAMPRLWASFQTATRSTLESTMEKLLLVANSLPEKRSLGNLEAQKFLDALERVISQVNTAAEQIHRSSQDYSQFNSNATAFLKQHIQNLVSKFGVDRDISKQLAANQEVCRMLQESIELIGPSLSALDNTIQRSKNSKVDFLEKMEEIRQSLSEVRNLKKATFSSLEAGIFVAPTTELESQLAKVSQELKTFQEFFQAKHEENETSKYSLSLVTKTLEETEARATQSASEVVIMQNSMQAAESRVREELGRASAISRDQSRARFEQQLHGILREKKALEHELAATKELLVNAHQTQSNNHISAEPLREQMGSLALTKDQEIEALQSRMSEDAPKYVAQDTELKRLQEAESSNAMQHGQSEQKLDALNQKIVTLEAKSASREINCQQLQTLQQKLDAFQAESLQKEEKLLSVHKDLNVANTEISALESGKAKAKGEIHILLLRLQDSERWMKNIRDKMEQFGVSAPTESFEEMWEKLGMLLHSAVFTGSPNAVQKDSMVEHVPGGTAITPITQTITAGPSQGFARTTEFIYRTQNVSRSTRCTPEARECFGSELPNSTVDCVPDSQVSANIVPFSSFQKRLSPTRCPSIKEDTAGFEKLLAQTHTPPNNITPSKCPISSQKPSNKRRHRVSSSSATGKNAREGRSPKVPGNLTSQGDAAKSQDLKDNSNDHKAVAFESQGAMSTEGHGKDAKATPSAQGRHGGDLLSERRPLRSTQRTYSKARQLPLSNRHRRESGTEDMDHNQSPTSVASGSSRKNLAREDRKKIWAARGQKRPGRRTKGERYSARFSQLGSDSR